MGVQLLTHVLRPLYTAGLSLRITADAMEAPVIRARAARLVFRLERLGEAAHALARTLRGVNLYGGLDVLIELGGEGGERFLRDLLPTMVIDDGVAERAGEPRLR